MSDVAFMQLKWVFRVVQTFNLFRPFIYTCKINIEGKNKMKFSPINKII